MDKNSFVLYTDVKEVLEELTNEQRGVLFTAIIDYNLGIEPTFTDPIVKMAFIPIRQSMDANSAKWEEKKAARSEAGKKGMEKRWGNKDNKAITDDNKNNNVITGDNKNNKVRRMFTPPTLEEVQAYCSERRNGVDAGTFIDFYSAKGWMVGKNKMKDWKACVRTWEQRQPRKTTATSDINDYLMQQATGGMGYEQTGSF